MSDKIDYEVYETATCSPDFLFFQRDRMGSKPLGLYHYEVERGYELRRMTREDSGEYQTEHVHFVGVGVTYQWRLPTADLRRMDSSKELMVEYTHGQELPGISSGELADHFCDFLALNQLRTWAEQNLKALDR